MREGVLRARRMSRVNENPRPTPGLMKGLNVRREAGGRHLQHRALRLRGAAEPMATDYKATTLCRQSVSGHVWLQLIEIRRCHETSRDRKANRTQEVVGSIPISSTHS